jgi:hypothetical protein
MPSEEVRRHLRRLSAAQSGVLQRSQLLRAGAAPSWITRRLRDGRWQVLQPGVYALHDLPVGDLTRVWAGILYVSRTGGVAAASGATALWLAGVLDRCPEVVEVVTTADRRVRRQPGLRVLHRERVAVHPAQEPARQRLEEALLDAVAAAHRPERVVDLVLRAGQRRLTTPRRLLTAARARRRLRWRTLVEDLCADLAAGVQSPLERRYEARVERRHGLPRGERNVAEPVAGARWYRDVRYRRWQVVVELDGRGAHPPEEAFRDRRRDNRAARAGDVSLRYGWREVVAAPCDVAGEVAQVLQQQGWPGRVRECGRSCTAVASQAEDFVPPGDTKSSA